MDSRSKWAFVGRIAVALIATALTIIWLYMATTHWSRIAARQPEWAILPQGAMLAAASMFCWLGVVRKSIWLWWVGLAVFFAAWILLGLIRLSREPVTFYVINNVVLACIGTVYAAITAMKQRKQDIEARKPDNPEGQ